MGAKTLKDIVAVEVERLSGGASVRATVTDGVVTLTGVVQNDLGRRVIEQELLRLPEVLDVRNHLDVARPANDLEAQFQALLERQHVATVGMRIEAKGSAILLSGQAASWFDRDAAERLAWTLAGVRRVENRITLPPDAVEPGVDGAGDPLA